MIMKIRVMSGTKLTGKIFGKKDACKTTDKKIMRPIKKFCMVNS